MDHYKIYTLLNNSSVSEVVEVNEVSGGQYFAKKNKRVNISMLRLDLCDYSDCILLWKRE